MNSPLPPPFSRRRLLTSLVGSALAWPTAACEELPRTYATRPASGTVVFEDDFERADLGEDWQPTGPGASVAHGRLVVRGLTNHPLWLSRELPDDVRVSFDAWPQSEEGDVKVEVAGDGKSFARTASYVASGYVFVFGGWNNSLDVIARRDEHGRDRFATAEPLPEANRKYRMIITRKANELRWEVDGREIAAMDDPSPLRGPGQRHFAFSGWEAEVHFDNLLIEAL